VGKSIQDVLDGLFGCTGCFPGQTKVLTATGEVAIASLHVGDTVQAEDPKTGQTGVRARAGR